MAEMASEKAVEYTSHASPPSQDIYEHLPLDVSHKEIRLLEILNTKPKLECRLFRVSLESNPEFIAISYTWEVALPLVSITLNGHEFLIRRNLQSALMQFHKSAPGACFWVDAICINQDCVPERNTQVPLMKDIYTSTSRVWVWLGRGTNRTGALVSMLFTLVFTLGCIKTANYDKIHEDQEKDGDEDEDEVEEEDRLYTTVLESLDQEKKEWFYLLCRPWFNRTWVYWSPRTTA